MAVSSGFRIVRDHDDRLAQRFIQITEEGKNPLGVFGVEIPCRLIGEQDSRVIHHGAGDRDSLLFTAGKRPRLVMQAMRDSKKVSTCWNSILIRM